ncbi:MAG: ribosome-associated translation inhibitor RaiA [Oscillospiraceae bacterium]|jgi:putative sigma-54 modulation protein|nr:ribosome-associated translation inhibitor RaiA [Oscillospiraceae bacterium]
MTFQLSAKDYPVSDKLHARLEKKVQKLGRYFSSNIETRVRLSSDKGDRRLCEITIPFEGGVLRAEESSDDMYQSIDGALAKIERQIHRHRTKLEKRLRENAFAPESAEYLEDAPQEEEDEHIERVKAYPIKPMSVEDAVLQMDMLGHAFFVFVNGDTRKTCVVYKRKMGGIGLLEPEE